MFRFGLVVAGEVQMDRAIARFAEGVTDYRPVWPVIEDDFYSLEKRQFASEGAVGGEQWAPLSEQYAGWKEAHYPGKPILQRSGHLMDSLTNPNNPDAVHIEERKSLTLGTRVPYGIYHQSIEPRAVLPRRPPILFNEAFKRTSMHHVQQHLVQIATRSGFRTGKTPGVAMGTAAGSAASWRRALGVASAGSQFSF